ncbi:OmpP1/FadL family transporter [Zhongshania marina]|uniref:Long-chain fatty acid transport protein n=1 Tax=Zhongshania marina TaxID=2304603 RepID=A0ABX9W889_9GAMM|nr:hypothetical protein D0911_04430 [Zhongshania marina]
MEKKLAVLLCFYTFVTCSQVMAGNGINDFGYGAISASLGGADLAVNTGVFALNTNPAGLANIENNRTEVNIEPFYYFNSHKDQFGKEEDLDPQASAVFAIGHAQRLDDNLVFALGLFAQGGAGFTYKNINTAFGNEDTISSSFGSFKIQSALAWESASGQVRIGAAVGLIYSEAEQELFSSTSVDDGAGNVFYGIDVTGVSGLSTGYRFGFQYDVDKDWSIGGSYSSRSQIKLEDGRAVLNQSASGFGKVTYKDASIKGLNIASDYGVGVAYRGFEKWEISADYMIVKWSDALEKSTLVLSNPSSPSATPDVMRLTSTLNWHDQKVIAIGARYDLSDISNLYFGYNYGRNPLPKEHTDPLLAVTANRHLTVGYSRNINKNIEFIGSIIYQPKLKVKYTNDELPYGDNAVNKWEVLVAHVLFVYHW